MIRDVSSTPREVARDAFRRMLDELEWTSQSPSRRRILEAFLHLATKYGVASVTMRMIGREINIKAPSIYAHFPDGRDEIVSESLRWYFHRFHVGVLQAVDGTDSAEQFWEELVTFHFTQQVTKPENDMFDLLIATDTLIHVLPDGLRAQIESWGDVYKNLYVAAAAELGFSDAPARLPVIMAVLESANSWHRGGTEAAAIEAGARRAVVITRGILASGW